MRILMTFAVVATLATSATARPTAPPPELMATIAITTGTGLQPVRDLANAIKPGAGAMLTDQVMKMALANMVKAASLDGLDTTGWAYVLVVDSGDAAVLGKLDHPLAAGTVFVAKDRWALVGPKAVTDKLAGFAFDVLAKQASPNQPMATIYAPNVMARFKSKIADMRTQMIATAKAQMTDWLVMDFDAMVSLANDTEKVVIGLGASSTSATVDLALVPFASSKLAKFNATQKPSAFELLDKLPPTHAAMLLAGHLETGPYRDGLLDMMMKMYSGSALVSGEVGAAIAAIMKASTGDLAMTGELGGGRGFAVTQVFALADQPSAAAAVGKLVDLFKKPVSFQTVGYTTTFKARPTPATHDNVTILGYEIAYDFSKLPAAQQTTMKAMFPTDTHARVAVFDKLGVFVMGATADAETNLVIDTARGKGSHYAAPPAVADLLAAARTRKDSFACVIDFASIAALVGGRPAAPGASSPGVIALGFADKQLHVRLSAAFATLKTLAHTGP